MLNSGSSKFSHAFSFESAFTYNNPSHPSMKSKYQTSCKSAFSSEHQSIQLDELHLSECKSKEMFLSKALRVIIVCVSYIIVLGFFPLSLWFCVKRIHALERLVVFRLGKLQPVVGPGFCLVLPIVDLWSRVDLNTKTYALPAQQLITADGAIVEVAAEIKYCVGHVVHYVTRLHSQEHCVKDLSLCCITNLITGKDQSDVEKHREIITSHAKIELNKTVISWGVQVLEVLMPTVKVIKEAEYVNPLNSILRVLKAVNCNGNIENTANLILTTEPKLPDVKGFEKSNDLHIPVLEQSCTDAVLLKIQSIAEEATNDTALNDVCAVYQFRIIDKPNQDRIIFLSFQTGTAKVFDGENASLKPDVILTLNQNVMEDLLNLKISPVQAYIEGEIKIIGDFNLLKLLNNMINGS